MKIFFNFKIQIKNFQPAFTLVELLVATSLFSAITLGSLSVLTSAENAYKRVSNNRTTIDNINIVMDTISREIKFGSDYKCANSNLSLNFRTADTINYNSLIYLTDKVTNCNALSFIPQGEDNKRIVYYYDIAKSSINQVVYEEISGSYYTRIEDKPLTSKNFKIDSFYFRLNGLSRSDFFQPKVEIRVSGLITSLRNKVGQLITTNLSAQTIATQRILDN